ncbi:hypothetical protein Tco_1387629, partial [Tanacetum coccineum]
AELIEKAQGLMNLQGSSKANIGITVVDATSAASEGSTNLRKGKGFKLETCMRLASFFCGWREIHNRAIDVLGSN